MAYSDEKDEIKAVLEMIRNNSITPREGQLRLEQLRRKSAPVSFRSEEPQRDRSKPSPDIAIIGMSGRFPGADNLDAFWELLSQGRSAVSEVPQTRWDVERYYDPDPKRLDKTHSRWGGFLEDADKFDPLFFNISGMEAEVMDPQQRLFLEESWAALEQAGYANDSMSGRACGVYVGAAPRDYLNLIEDKGVPASAQVFWGNTGSILASRISYLLNLKGPAITVDTACSSSLVAVHLACQALLTGEAEMAVAGGVWLCTTPHYYIMTSNAGMLSPDGKCKAFDNGADGIVNGEGVGAVVLKPLDRALEDGDYVHGIIRSSGINQDGKTNGITAPSSLSQTRLELDVYAKGNIHPETITYVEAHGTGTKLGDPIEIEALNQSFRTYTDKRQYCAVGSVKTNIGHACMAAGVASLLKLVLALTNRQLPPSLHFEQENEHIRLEGSPFYINTDLQEWKGHDGLRRGAVSSFGLSGTNVHMVVDGPAPNKRSSAEHPFYIAAFSAKTPALLRRRVEDFLKWSGRRSGVHAMGDICYTLSVCRKHFQYRAAFVAAGQTELNRQLEAWLGKETPDRPLAGDKPEPDQIRQWISDLDRTDLSAPVCEGILRKLGDAYRNGAEPDWASCYPPVQFLKVPLPTYPFAREYHWIGDGGREKATADIHGYRGVQAARALHPLVDENISGLNGISFQTRPEGNPFLGACEWEGESFIPPGCYLEMALTAGERSGQKSIRTVKELVCVPPAINAWSTTMLHTRLYPDGEGCYVEIAAVDGAEESVCMQAKLEYGQKTADRPFAPRRIDVHAIKEGCEFLMEQEAYYAYMLRHHRYRYGGAFRAIRQVWHSAAGQEALGAWSIPDEANPGADRFIVHPACMEACYQLALLLSQLGEDEGGYEIGGFGRLDMLAPLGEKGYVHVWPFVREETGREEYRRYGASVVNADGTVALAIEGLAIRRFQNSRQSDILTTAAVQEARYV